MTELRTAAISAAATRALAPRSVRTLGILAQDRSRELTRHSALQQPDNLRRDAADITVLKSVGCALEDMVAARRLLLSAGDQNRG
jgi:ornithine cyclodeaminase/alanine dehydrogenase-like protein (mu-crystallin family)